VAGPQQEQRYHRADSVTHVETYDCVDTCVCFHNAWFHTAIGEHDQLSVMFKAHPHISKSRTAATYVVLFVRSHRFKGDLRSKALGAILGEARELVDAGVKEIILVAQHLTDYGRDLKLKDGLAVLLRERVRSCLKIAGSVDVCVSCIDYASRDANDCRLFADRSLFGHAATTRTSRYFAPDASSTGYHQDQAHHC
jgi:hypothetical protein